MSFNRTITANALHRITMFRCSCNESKHTFDNFRGYFDILWSKRKWLLSLFRHASSGNKTSYLYSNWTKVIIQIDIWWLPVNLFWISNRQQSGGSTRGTCKVLPVLTSLDSKPWVQEMTLSADWTCLSYFHVDSSYRIDHLEPRLPVEISTLSATAQDPYKYIKLGDNEWKRSIWYLRKVCTDL